MGRDDQAQQEAARQEARARTEFVQQALASAAGWAQFADPKLAGVLAFLSLGIANLLSHAHPLWEAHNTHTAWGWMATISFFVAAGLAGLTVAFATLGLFPRVKPKNGPKSLYYFGGIASYEDGDKYLEAVKAKEAAQLDGELARQVWEIASIATTKHAWARRGYYAVVAFLIAWVAARTGLAFTP